MDSQDRIKSRYANDLKVDSFAHLLDDNSQCYKFYWLEAVVNLCVRGQLQFTFETAADEMIVQAWYTVAEYHLRMGSSYYGENDHGAFEKAISKLQKITGLSSNAKEEELRFALSRYHDSLKQEKAQLVKMVPYRLLSKMLAPHMNDRIWNSEKRTCEVIETVNLEKRLPYVIEYHSGLEKTVILDSEWARFICDNYLIIRSWIDAKKIRYLSDRNPGVPGIVYKLSGAEKRESLKLVHNLWDAVMEQTEVMDIYTGKALNDSAYDMDHFIPWSYIVSDELWDLIPADSSLNSSKSNSLPAWEKYYPGFADQQYLLYREASGSEQIHQRMDQCRQKHLNSLWASEKLYQPGHSCEEFKGILLDHVRPVYDGAVLQGYSFWQNT